MFVVSISQSKKGTNLDLACRDGKEDVVAATFAQQTACQMTVMYGKTEKLDSTLPPSMSAKSWDVPLKKLIKSRGGA